MAIKFHCSHCGTLLKVKDDRAGHRAPCPNCGSPITVPGDRDDDFIRSNAPLPSQSFHPRREPFKPGKVQAVAIMMLIGGILALFHALTFVAVSFFLCLLYPGIYFAVVLGIMAIVRGSSLLGVDAHMNHPPRGIAIMQIINIVNLDIVNCVLGIISLVFLNDPEIQEYFET